MCNGFIVLYFTHHTFPLPKRKPQRLLLCSQICANTITVGFRTFRIFSLPPPIKFMNDFYNEDSDLSSFSLVDHTFALGSKIASSNSRPQHFFFSHFPPRSLLVLGFTFRSLIHFELIFVDGGWHESEPLFCIWMSKCCICWKVPSAELLWYLWWRVICWCVCKLISVPVISPSVFALLPCCPDWGSPHRVPSWEMLVPSWAMLVPPKLQLLFQSRLGCCRVLIYFHVNFRISSQSLPRGACQGLHRPYYNQKGMDILPTLSLPSRE